MPSEQIELASEEDSQGEPPPQQKSTPIKPVAIYKSFEESVPEPNDPYLSFSRTYPSSISNPAPSMTAVEPVGSHPIHNLHPFSTPRFSAFRPVSHIGVNETNPWSTNPTLSSPNSVDPQSENAPRSITPTESTVAVSASVVTMPSMTVMPISTMSTMTQGSTLHIVQSLSPVPSISTWAATNPSTPLNSVASTSMQSMPQTLMPTVAPRHSIDSSPSEPTMETQMKTRYPMLPPFEAISRSRSDAVKNLPSSYYMTSEQSIPTNLIEGNMKRDSNPSHQAFGRMELENSRILPGETMYETSDTPQASSSIQPIYQQPLENIAQYNSYMYSEQMKHQRPLNDYENSSEVDLTKIQQLPNTSIGVENIEPQMAAVHLGARTKQIMSKDPKMTSMHTMSQKLSSSTKNPEILSIETILKSQLGSTSVVNQTSESEHTFETSPSISAIDSHVSAMPYSYQVQSEDSISSGVRPASPFMHQYPLEYYMRPEYAMHPPGTSESNRNELTGMPLPEMRLDLATTTTSADHTVPSTTISDQHLGPEPSILSTNGVLFENDTESIPIIDNVSSKASLIINNHHIPKYDIWNKELPNDSVLMSNPSPQDSTSYSSMVLSQQQSPSSQSSEQWMQIMTSMPSKLTVQQSVDISATMTTASSIYQSELVTSYSSASEMTSQHAIQEKFSDPKSVTIPSSMQHFISQEQGPIKSITSELTLQRTVDNSAIITTTSSIYNSKILNSYSSTSEITSQHATLEKLSDPNSVTISSSVQNFISQEPRPTEVFTSMNLEPIAHEMPSTVTTQMHSLGQEKALENSSTKTSMHRMPIAFSMPSLFRKTPTVPIQRPAMDVNFNHEKSTINIVPQKPLQYPLDIKTPLIPTNTARETSSTEAGIPKLNSDTSDSLIPELPTKLDELNLDISTLPIKFVESMPPTSSSQFDQSILPMSEDQSILPDTICIPPDQSIVSEHSASAEEGSTTMQYAQDMFVVPLRSTEFITSVSMPEDQTSSIHPNSNIIPSTVLVPSKTLTSMPQEQFASSSPSSTFHGELLTTTKNQSTQSIASIVNLNSESLVTTAPQVPSIQTTSYISAILSESSKEVQCRLQPGNLSSDQPTGSNLHVPSVQARTTTTTSEPATNIQTSLAQSGPSTPTVQSGLYLIRLPTQLVSQTTNVLPKMQRVSQIPMQGQVRPQSIAMLTDSSQVFQKICVVQPVSTVNTSSPNSSISPQQQITVATEPPIQRLAFVQPASNITSESPRIQMQLVQCTNTQIFSSERTLTKTQYIPSSAVPPTSTTLTIKFPNLESIDLTTDISRNKNDINAIESQNTVFTNRTANNDSLNSVSASNNNSMRKIAIQSNVVIKPASKKAEDVNLQSPNLNNHNNLIRVSEIIGTQPLRFKPRKILSNANLPTKFLSSYPMRHAFVSLNKDNDDTTDKDSTHVGSGSQKNLAPTTNFNKTYIQFSNKIKNRNPKVIAVKRLPKSNNDEDDFENLITENQIFNNMNIETPECTLPEHEMDIINYKIKLQQESKTYNNTNVFLNNMIKNNSTDQISLSDLKETKSIGNDDNFTESDSDIESETNEIKIQVSDLVRDQVDTLFSSNKNRWKSTDSKRLHPSSMTVDLNYIGTEATVFIPLEDYKEKTQQIIIPDKCNFSETTKTIPVTKNKKTQPEELSSLDLYERRKKMRRPKTQPNREVKDVQRSESKKIQSNERDIITPGNIKAEIYEEFASVNLSKTDECKEDESDYYDDEPVDYNNLIKKFGANKNGNRDAKIKFLRNFMLGTHDICKEILWSKRERMICRDKIALAYIGAGRLDRLAIHDAPHDNTEIGNAPTYSPMLENINVKYLNGNSIDFKKKQTFLSQMCLRRVTRKERDVNEYTWQEILKERKRRYCSQSDSNKFKKPRLTNQNRDEEVEINTHTALQILSQIQNCVTENNNLIKKRLDKSCQDEGENIKALAEKNFSELDRLSKMADRSVKHYSGQDFRKRELSVYDSENIQGPVPKQGPPKINSVNHPSLTIPSVPQIMSMEPIAMMQGTSMDEPQNLAQMKEMFNDAVKNIAKDITCQKSGVSGVEDLMKMYAEIERIRKKEIVELTRRNTALRVEGAHITRSASRDTDKARALLAERRNLALEEELVRKTIQRLLIAVDVIRSYR